MKLSFVLPASNENDFEIIRTIEKIKKTFNNAEIVVVLNGTNRRNLLSKNVKTIYFPNSIGKGKAITKGLEIVRGDVVAFIDADDTFEISYTRKWIKEFEKNSADCIIASKWKGKKFHEVKGPLERKIASRIWNFIVRGLFNLDFADTQAGAKFFTKKALMKIGRNFQSSGFEIDVELLAKFRKNRFRIKEFYLPYKNYADGSNFKIWHSIPMFFNIIKLRRKIAA